MELCIDLRHLCFHKLEPYCLEVSMVKYHFPLPLKRFSGAEANKGSYLHFACYYYRNVAK